MNRGMQVGACVGQAEDLGCGIPTCRSRRFPLGEQDTIGGIGAAALLFPGSLRGQVITTAAGTPWVFPSSTVSAAAVERNAGAAGRSAIADSVHQHEAVER